MSIAWPLIKKLPPLEPRLPIMPMPIAMERGACALLRRLMDLAMVFLQAQSEVQGCSGSDAAGSILKGRSVRHCHYAFSPSCRELQTESPQAEGGLLAYTALRR